MAEQHSFEKQGSAKLGADGVPASRPVPSGLHEAAAKAEETFKNAYRVISHKFPHLKHSEVEAKVSELGAQVVMDEHNKPVVKPTEDEARAAMTETINNTIEAIEAPDGVVGAGDSTDGPKPFGT